MHLMCLIGRHKTRPIRVRLIDAVIIGMPLGGVVDFCERCNQFVGKLYVTFESYERRDAHAR